MTATQPPAPMTTDDYAGRMTRVVADATAAGLDGLLITPGPDLVWLTGYQPTAITERLTVIVLTPGQRPTLLVPTLERPDAEGAVGAPALSIVDWADGEDPFERASALLQEHATMGISDSAWAM
ncbi:MAG: aminopeptidase P family N-terminal domain-containing protein, partial [Marmoricola sp.]